MTQKTEMGPSDTVRNDGEGDTTTTLGNETTREPSTSNWVQGRGRGGRGGISGHQGCGGLCGQLNLPAYRRIL